jgi:methyl-accepting chemotaxis protein
MGQIGSVARAMSQNSTVVIQSIELITGSVSDNLTATQQMSSHSGEVSSAFDQIASISQQNAASVEVLTYVNHEVTSAAQRIVASVEDLNRFVGAIDEQLTKYTVRDESAEEVNA